MLPFELTDGESIGSALECGPDAVVHLAAVASNREAWSDPGAGVGGERRRHRPPGGGAGRRRARGWRPNRSCWWSRAVRCTGTASGCRARSRIASAALALRREQSRGRGGGARDLAPGGSAARSWPGRSPTPGRASRLDSCSRPSWRVCAQARARGGGGADRKSRAGARSAGRARCGGGIRWPCSGRDGPARRTTSRGARDNRSRTCSPARDAGRRGGGAGARPGAEPGPGPPLLVGDPTKLRRGDRLGAHDLIGRRRCGDWWMPKRTDLRPFS